jgi:hypothetical protein
MSTTFQYICQDKFQEFSKNLAPIAHNTRYMPFAQKIIENEVLTGINKHCTFKWNGENHEILALSFYYRISIYLMQNSRKYVSSRCRYCTHKTF